MKSYSKSISLALLVSILGIQFSFAQTSQIKQDYKIVPPADSQSMQLPTLPNISDYAPLKGSVSVVPAGTTFAVNMASNINSLSNQVGEIFTANLAEPVVLDGRTVIPVGSEVIGQITYIENAGRVGKNGVMEIKFISIKPLGQSFKIPITGKVMTVDNTGVLKGGSLKKQLVKVVGTGAIGTAGGTLAGLSLGSMIGSAGAGAVFGTAAGGLISVGYIIARKGREITLSSDTKLNVQLEQPLTVTNE